MRYGLNRNMDSAKKKSNDEIKILAVVPLFNNIKTVREVVEGVLSSGLDLLVVNDGSNDGSPEALEGLPATIISHARNMGKGVAIRTAGKWADEHNYSHIITIDADGQHNPSEIGKFVDKIHNAPRSIIVGNRSFGGQCVPFSSRFGRKNSNFWVKTACGATLPDTQSGFRAYPAETVNKVACHSDKYDYEVEILVKSVWAGLSLESVDISVKYSEETREASHFHPWLDNLRCTRIFLFLVFRNFLPWPHKIIFGDSQAKQLKFSLMHPWKTLKMLIMEKTSPGEIAFACALGILLGTLPLIGIHCAAIVFCATRLKFNRLIALNISHFCMPPFVPAICLEVGYYARHGEFLSNFDWHTLGEQMGSRIVDYLIGSLICAPIFAVAIGIIAYFSAKCAHQALTQKKEKEQHDS